MQRDTPSHFAPLRDRGKPPADFILAADYWLRPQSEWAERYCAALGRARDFFPLLKSYETAPDTRLNGEMIRRGTELMADLAWLKEDWPADLGADEETCREIARDLDALVLKTNTLMGSSDGEVLERVKTIAASPEAMSPAQANDAVADLQRIIETWRARPDFDRAPAIQEMVRGMEEVLESLPTEDRGPTDG